MDTLLRPSEARIHRRDDWKTSAYAQRHRDSTGSTVLVDERSVQTMSAGTGIMHSELNASETAPFHSYQIWVYPRERGGAPRHEAFHWRSDDARDRFVLALSPDRREGSALIGQDAFFALGTFDAGKGGRYALHGAGQGVYVHCASGEAIVAGARLRAGDAIGVWEAEACAVEAITAVELVLVEVPMARGVRV